MRTPLWLRRMRGWLASHDPALDVAFAEKGGCKPAKFGPYDERKAVVGMAKSRRQTETGRPYQLVLKSGVVIDMKRGQR